MKTKNRKGSRISSRKTQRTKNPRSKGGMGFMGRLFGKKPEQKEFPLEKFATANPDNHFAVPNNRILNEQNDQKKRAEYNRLITPVAPAPAPNRGPLGMFPYMKGIHNYARDVLESEGKIQIQDNNLITMDPKTDPRYATAKQTLDAERVKLQNLKESNYNIFQKQKNQPFQFTEYSQSNLIKVSDTIGVFPCLQELRAYKGVGTMTGGETEQQPAHWDPIDHTLTSIMKGVVYTNASNDYYRYWSGNIPPSIIPLLTKNGVLNIPNCIPFGLNPKGCGSMDCPSKWAMFTKYFIETKRIEKIDVMMMVAHHNRMVTSDKMQQLIPLTAEAEGKKMRYANLFTLVVDIKKPANEPCKIGFSVKVKGFPDKGGFPGSKRKGYTYVDDVKYLNTEMIEKGIQSAFRLEDIFEGMITLSRHGNSLHNKPIDIQGRYKRFDSCLTPLGFLQAKIAGTTLIDTFKGKKVKLVTSFLGRTQMTGSLMLQYAGATMHPDLVEFIQYMKHQSYYRFFYHDNMLKVFEGCSPMNDPDYQQYDIPGKFKDIGEEAINYVKTFFPNKLHLVVLPNLNYLVSPPAVGGQRRSGRKQIKTRSRKPRTIRSRA